MSRRILSLALATTFLASPAFAATKADLKEAHTQYHDELKLQRRFNAAEKQWNKGFDKQKSGTMLTAGKKLTAWIADAIDEVPRHVLREARDGEDDTVRQRYADALVSLRASLHQNGGDGRPQVDAATHDVLAHIHDDLVFRVTVRKAREVRIKQEYKASK